MQRNTVTGGALCALAFSLALTASAAGAPSTKLLVRSAAVDLEAHSADIELFNSGDKTVVAYTVQVEEFDAAGKLIFTKTTGRDNRYYPISGVDRALQSGEAYLIHPGQVFTDTEALQPEAATVKASILSVVNEDRTIEGDRANAHLFFLQRAETAKQIKQSLALLKTYPATAGELSRTLESLRSQDFGYLAISILVNQLHLSAATYNALIDKTKPLPDVGLLNEKQWNGFINELAKAVAFSDLQSQEATQ